MTSFGGITLDGSLSDWSATNNLSIEESVAKQFGFVPNGTQLFAKSSGDALIFGLKTSQLTGTNILIDADQNEATGANINGHFNESLVKSPNAYVLARGIDYQISFDPTGAASLYSGDGIFVSTLASAKMGDIVEFAAPSSLLGGSAAARVMLEFYNGFYGINYSPPSFIVVPSQQVGDITLDGELSDWSTTQRLDTEQTGIAGYELYGKSTDNSFVIALKAPIAIGANTTAWINTDANMATGHKIWGFAGGAEYYVNFDAAGNPALYTGDAGQTLVAASLAHAFSADHTIVEFAVPKALIGNPDEINTLYDINDSVFLPTRYLSTQYKIADTSATNQAPIISSNDGDAATITAVKNTDDVTQVLASDPDGDTLTYAILSGLDALQFNIDASTGVLSFVTAPDFLNPTDENGDNIYNVTVAAVDPFGRSDTQALSVAVAPPSFGGITLDGSLSDWSATNNLSIEESVAKQFGFVPNGTQLFAKSSGDALIFGLKTSQLTGTNILIDADQNEATGANINGHFNESLVKSPNAYVLARGIDYQISFDPTGAASLYSGDGIFVSTLASAKMGDIVEFAAPSSLLGGSAAARVMLEFYNGFYGINYSPPSFIVVPSQQVGDITLDGELSDWSTTQRLDTEQTGIAGYELYGKSTDNSFVIALKAPIAIGANTTAWINTDANMATGHKIWGFAGGAEYYVNFDAAGNPALYTGDAGQTLVAASLAHAFSADHTIVEFAVPKALIGNPDEINTLYDINDSVFLPTRYLSTQYKIADTSATNQAPIISSNDGDAATITAVKNTDDVTQVLASDPDGDTLTYAILSGLDALQFNIDASTGVLSFVTAPDFLNPTDENGDNIYNVTVAAVDPFGRSDTQALSVAVADDSSTLEFQVGLIGYTEPNMADTIL